MQQVIADKESGYADTIKKLRAKYDFAELKNEAVAKSWIDFLVTSWTKDGEGQLLKTNPRGVAGDLRRRREDQGGEGRRGRDEEPVARRWCDGRDHRERPEGDERHDPAPRSGTSRAGDTRRAVTLVDSTSTR